MSEQPPWMLADRSTLAAHLEAALVHSAQDVDGASIYHYRLDNRERIAVALPTGTCLLLAAAAPEAAPQERRRLRNTSKPGR
jgi:hypothetical protein